MDHNYYYHMYSFFGKIHFEVITQKANRNHKKHINLLNLLSMTLNLHSCLPTLLSCFPKVFSCSPTLHFCSPTLFSSTPKVFSHAPTLRFSSPRILFCNPDLHSCFPTLLSCSLLINSSTRETILTYKNYLNNKKQLYTTNGHAANTRLCSLAG